MQRVTTYKPLPITFTHGKGCWLYDEKGEAYLDGFGGIAVNILGHAHPAVLKTIQDQAAKFIHTSNALRIPQQEALAEKLCTMTGLQQAFFTNSGAEANEAAFKLARLYGHQKGIETPTIIVMENAFHGRTLAAVAATGSRKVQAGFEPFVPGFVRAPYNAIEPILAMTQHRRDIVGIMLEPIQGESGVTPADETYLREIEKLCQKNDWLLILDEVQTGNGRTGQYFRYMDLGLKPDIVTTAKGLANGIPIGVCLMGPKASDLFKPGNHGSTFGGNPLACAVALTVIDVIEKEGLCAHAAKMGKKLIAMLHEAFDNHPKVKTIRGIGLMIGIELNEPAEPYKQKAADEKLLINVTAEKVIRLLPPLIITEEECGQVVERLVKTLG